MGLLRSTVVAALAVGAVLAVRDVQDVQAVQPVQPVKAVGAAADRDDIVVRPGAVGEGDVARVSIRCRDYTDAYVTSDAFGTVDFGGESSVEVTVSAKPGRYQVKGTCGRGHDWLQGKTWLVVRSGHEHRHDKGHGNGHGGDDERRGLFDRFQRDRPDHGDDGGHGLFDLISRYGHDGDRDWERGDRWGHGDHGDRWGDGDRWGHGGGFFDREGERGDGLFGILGRFRGEEERSSFRGEFGGESRADVEDEWGYHGPATGGGSTAMRAVSPVVSVGVGVAALAAVGLVVVFTRRLRARGR